MKGRRKSREKSPARLEWKGSAKQPARGKRAPIIEEPGRKQTRLEADASYLSTGQKRLPEMEPARVEADLRRREEGARLDLEAAFRRRPQGLVEMVAAIRLHGGADLLRDLVFAAQTLYGDHPRELPGGIEFWQDLSREVAPLPHPPALTPADLQLQRLQAIEIFREAVVSYEMLTDHAPPVPYKPPPPTKRVETAQSGPANGPARMAPGPPAPGPEAPSPPGAAAGPSPTMEEQMRLAQIAERIKEQEAALKKETESLIQREQALLALEERLEGKEKELLASEEEAKKGLAGHEAELAKLRGREASLTSELERTRTLQQDTARELESERAGLEKLREQLRSESEERSRTAEQELQARRSELAARESALAETEKALRQQEARLEEDRRLLEAANAEAAPLPPPPPTQEATLPPPPPPPLPPPASPTLDAKPPRFSPSAPDEISPEPSTSLPLPPPPPHPPPAHAGAPPEPSSPAVPETSPAPAPSPPSKIQESSILSRLASLAATPTKVTASEPAPSPEIPAPEAEEPDRKVLYKVKCPGCKAVIPVFTRDRPLNIKCGSCGKEGVLK